MMIDASFLRMLTSCQRYLSVAAIVETCRDLREPELRKCIVEDQGVDEWLGFLPETLTWMVSFGFFFQDFERLVTWCPYLKSINLIRTVTLYLPKYLQAAFTSYAAVRMPDLVDLQSKRLKLQKEKILEADVTPREQGLVSVSEGWPKLESFLQLTNAALVSIAVNPRLCVIEPSAPDYKPLDERFKIIAEECKYLQRFCVSSLLTHIGKHTMNLVGDSDLGLYHLLSGGCGSLRKK